MSDNCQKARELFDALLDGEISPEDSAFLEKHLQECETCRAELAIYRSMLEALHTPIPEPPASIHDAVMARLPKQKRHAKVLRRLRILGSAAVAAMVCVALVRMPGVFKFAANESDKSLAEGHSQLAAVGNNQSYHYNSDLENSSELQKPNSDATKNELSDRDDQDGSGDRSPESSALAPDAVGDGYAGLYEIDRFAHHLVLDGNGNAILILHSSAGDEFISATYERDGRFLYLTSEQGLAWFEVDKYTLYPRESWIPGFDAKGQ